MAIDNNTLRQFTGSESVYRHSLMRNIVYTEGVQYVAEQGGAYWLLDKIATLQLEPKIKAEEFQVWKLKVADQKGELIVEDGNDNVVYQEAISYTDFPLDEIIIWLTNNTMLLPSEY